LEPLSPPFTTPSLIPAFPFLGGSWDLLATHTHTHAAGQPFHAYDEGNLNWLAAAEVESATSAMCLRVSVPPVTAQSGDAADAEIEARLDFVSLPSFPVFHPSIHPTHRSMSPIHPHVHTAPRSPPVLS
jgi:hypothetical protein